MCSCWSHFVPLLHPVVKPAHRVVNITSGSGVKYSQLLHMRPNSPSSYFQVSWESSAAQWELKQGGKKSTRIRWSLADTEAISSEAGKGGEREKQTDENREGVVIKWLRGMQYRISWFEKQKQVCQRGLPHHLFSAAEMYSGERCVTLHRFKLLP